jgi:type II secretory pathway component GspD/PulD (secretin)
MPVNSRIFNGNRAVACGLVLFGILFGCSILPAQRPYVRGTQYPNPGQPQAPKPFVLDMLVVEGRVTANITNCPLQTVLQELADRTGILFEVRSQDNSQVSIHLNRVVLPEAIQRIASNSNTMFFYGKGTPGFEPITLVRVFSRTNPVQQPGLVYLGSGVVTKSNETVETPEQAIKVLSENTDVKMREKAIEILVHSENDGALKALVNSVLDPAPEVRIAAIEGLAARDAHKALPVILKSLKDPHPKVRQSAINAVAFLGDSQNLNNLKPLIADRDQGVVAAARIAIVKLSAAVKR